MSTVERAYRRNFGDGSAFFNIYTAPANIHGMVNEIVATNISGSNATVSVALYPLGVAANKVLLVKDQVLTPKQQIFFTGALVLESSDAIEVKSSTSSSLDCSMAITERPNNANPLGKRAYELAVGTTLVELYKVALNKQVSINHMQFCNVSGSAALLTLEKRIADVAGNNIMLAKEVPLEPNQTYSYVGTEHLTNEDSIYVKSSVASSIDAIVGGLQFT